MLLCQWGREWRDCTHPQCQRRRQPWTGPRNPFGQSWSGCPGPGGPATPEPLAGCTHATDKYTHIYILGMCVCMCVFFSSLYNLYPSQKYKEILCSILFHYVCQLSLHMSWEKDEAVFPALNLLTSTASSHSQASTLFIKHSTMPIKWKTNSTLDFFVFPKNKQSFPRSV